MAFEFLRVLITTTISQLNAMGVGGNERVGIALANGPEMAYALWAAQVWLSARGCFQCLLQFYWAGRSLNRQLSNLTNPFG